MQHVLHNQGSLSHVHMQNVLHRVFGHALGPIGTVVLLQGAGLEKMGVSTRKHRHFGFLPENMSPPYGVLSSGVVPPGSYIPRVRAYPHVAYT